jgi:acyl carrier protein
MSIEKRIITFVSNFIKIEIPLEKSSRKRSLQDLIPSSLIYMELLVALEKEFNFEFDDSKLDYLTFNSMDSLADYVSSKENI